MVTSIVILSTLLLLASVLLVLIARENIDYRKRQMNSNLEYKTRLGSDFNIFDDEY